MKATLLAVACAMLAGCSNEDPDDFGARMVADQIILAQRKCASAKANGLEECKSSTDREARISAKTAEDMQESYFTGCGEVIGLSKCETLLNIAYEKSRP